MTFRARGFTLVELLVVLAVLGVLASMAMPLAEVTLQRERERELKRSLWQIRDAIDAYAAARSSGAVTAAAGASVYPPTLRALTVATPDARPDHRGETLRFLRKVPRDPFADASTADEETWAPRSLASEAQDPQPGADVFDVHSRSERTGLNGIPLRRW